MSSQDTRQSSLKRYLMPVPLALAAFLLVAGISIGQFLPVRQWLVPDAGPDQAAPDAWRAAFAADFSLTTTQTLVTMPQEDRLTRIGLGVLGKKLGLDLTQERLVLPKELLQRAGLFFFQNALVGQVVYVDDENGAIALYFLRREQAPEPIAGERRNGMNVAYWSSGSHAFMLVGVAPDTVLAELAAKLKGRLGS